MAVFDDAFARAVLARVWRQYVTLGDALGLVQAREDGSRVNGRAWHESSPLHDDMRLLVSIANGERTRTDEGVAEAGAALARVMDAFFGTAYGEGLLVPEALWDTRLGVLLSRVRWWISMDDLISISAAAILAYGENTQATRMRIARAIEHGTLQWVPDPSVANPQQRKRVLRSEVEQLHASQPLLDAPDAANMHSGE